MIDSLVGKTFKSYKILRRIGKGQSATVFQGINTKNNQPVAMKVIMINIYNSKHSQIIRNKALAQVAILKSCNNDNIIKFIDSFQASHFYFFIVTQFCNGGDLGQYMLTKSIEEDEAVVFLKHILNGFNGMHKIGIMHRDFKAANVLINDGVCKIADFGLSKQMGAESMTTTNVGTPLTNAPQILSGKEYGFQTDIWSIGVVFYQMLFDEYPFIQKDQKGILQIIKNGQPNYKSEHKKISKQSIDFLRKCLKINPKQRISWAEIYKHPLIAGSDGHGHNQNHGVSNSSLKNIDVENNLQFYLTTKLMEHSVVQQKQVEDISKSISKKDMDDLKKSIGNIPAQVFNVVDRFQQLYLARKDKIMFFYKHIHPCIQNVQFIQLNHAVIGFIFSKKAYLQISQTLELISKKIPIFPREPDFPTYTKTQNYANMHKIFSQQKSKLHQLCLQYRQKIKHKSLQIQNQYNIDNVNNCNNVLTVLIGDYLRFLGRELRELKELKECQGGRKMEVLRLMRVLQYYANNRDRVDQAEYGVVMEKEKLENCQGKYLGRYGSM